MREPFGGISPRAFPDGKPVPTLPRPMESRVSHLTTFPFFRPELAIRLVFPSFRNFLSFPRRIGRTRGRRNDEKSGIYLYRGETILYPGAVNFFFSPLLSSIIPITQIFETARKNIIIAVTITIMMMTIIIIIIITI